MCSLQNNDSGSAVCAFVFPLGVCVVELVILKQSESKVTDKMSSFI